MLPGKHSTEESDMSQFLTDYVGTIFVAIAVATFIGMAFGAYGERYVRTFHVQKTLIGGILLAAGGICMALAPWSQAAVFNFNGAAGLIAAAAMSAAAFVAGPAMLGHLAFMTCDDIRKSFTKPSYSR